VSAVSCLVSGCRGTRSSPWKRRGHICRTGAPMPKTPTDSDTTAPIEENDRAVVPSWRQGRRTMRSRTCPHCSSARLGVIIRGAWGQSELHPRDGRGRHRFISGDCASWIAGEAMNPRPRAFERSKDGPRRRGLSRRETTSVGNFDSENRGDHAWASAFTIKWRFQVHTDISSTHVAHQQAMA